MIFSQPFPSYQPSFKTLRFTFYAGVVVFLILAVFKPFGFGHTPHEVLNRNALIFGLATFLVASLNAFLLPALFPSVYGEERWTVGKELLMMLWQVLTISLGNLVLMHVLYHDQLSWSNVIQTLGITTAVGIFPITLIILLKQQILLRKYSQGAVILEEQLQQEEGTVPEKPLVIQFASDNRNEQLNVPLPDLRFISAADNYIRIHFVRNDSLTVYLLRSTLKKAEEVVKDYPQLFRCHRTYLVNLASVERVTGNAQGYKLHLKDASEPIPVSRSLNNELSEHIQKYALLSH